MAAKVYDVAQALDVTVEDVDPKVDNIDALPLKRKGIECSPAQKHMRDVDTSLASWRGCRSKATLGTDFRVSHRIMSGSHMRYCLAIDRVPGTICVVSLDFENTAGSASTRSFPSVTSPIRSAYG